MAARLVVRLLALALATVAVAAAAADDEAKQDSLAHEQKVKRGAICNDLFVFSTANSKDGGWFAAQLDVDNINLNNAVSHDKPNNAIGGDVNAFACSSDGLLVIAREKTFNLEVWTKDPLQPTRWVHYQTIETPLAENNRNEASSHQLSFVGDVIVLGTKYFSMNGAGKDGTSLKATKLGIVHIFEYNRSSGDWGLTDKLLSPRPVVEKAQFGSSVALSSDMQYLFVGEDRALDSKNKNAGWMHVYKRSKQDGPNRRWGLLQSFHAPDSALNVKDGFGHEIAVDGDTLVVTARNAGSNRDGTVYFYRRSENGLWEAAQVFRPETFTKKDVACGSGVSISGRLAIATCLERFDGQGSFVIFRQISEGVWSKTDELLSDSPKVTRQLTMAGNRAMANNRDEDNAILLIVPPSWLTELAEGNYTALPSPETLNESTVNDTQTGDHGAPLTEQECRTRLSRQPRTSRQSACGRCLPGYLGDPSNDGPCRPSAIDGATSEKLAWNVSSSLGIADLYGNGALSVVVPSATGGPAQVFRQDAQSGSGEQLVQHSVGGDAFSAVSSLAFVDIDGDGDLDAVGAALPGSATSVVFFRNVGNRTAPVFERFAGTTEAGNMFGLLSMSDTNSNAKASVMVLPSEPAQVMLAFEDVSGSMKLFILGCQDLTCSVVHDITASYSMVSAGDMPQLDSAVMLRTVAGPLLTVLAASGEVVSYLVHTGDEHDREVQLVDVFGDLEIPPGSRLASGPAFSQFGPAFSQFDALYVMADGSVSADVTRVTFSFPAAVSSFSFTSNAKWLEPHPAMGPGVNVLALLDIDRDGDVDMVFANGDDRLYVSQNDQQGSGRRGFTHLSEYPPLDLAATELASEHGALVSLTFVQELTSPGSIAAVVTANASLHVLEQLAGEDNFALVPKARNPLAYVRASSFGNVEFADLNGDGLLDLVVGLGSGRFDFYINNGTTGAAAYPLSPSREVVIEELEPYVHTAITISSTIEDNRTIALITGGGLLHPYVVRDVFDLEKCTDCSLQNITQIKSKAPDPVLNRAIALAWDFDGDLDLDIVIASTGSLGLWVNTGSDCSTDCHGRGQCIQSLDPHSEEKKWQDHRGETVESWDAIGMCLCEENFDGRNCEICRANRLGQYCQGSCQTYAATPVSKQVRAFPGYRTAESCECQNTFHDSAGECVCEADQVVARKETDQPECGYCPLGTFKAGPGNDTCVTCGELLGANAVLMDGTVCGCAKSFEEVNGTCGCEAGRYYAGDAQHCERCPDSRPDTFAPGATSIDSCLARSGTFAHWDNTVLSCQSPRFLGKIDCSSTGMRTETLNIVKGHWRPNDRSLNILHCRRTAHCQQTSTLPGNEYCTEHHIGTLCSSCEAGFAKSEGGHCVDCETLHDKAVAVAVCTVVLCSIFIFGPACWLMFRLWSEEGKPNVFSSTTSSSEPPSSSWTCCGLSSLGSSLRGLNAWQPARIFIGFSQVWLLHMGATVMVSTGATSTVLNVLAVPINLDVTDLLSSTALACIWDIDLYTRLFVKTVVPLLSVAVLSLQLIVVRCMDQTRFNVALSVAIRAVVVILFLVYPSVTNSIVKIFVVEEIEDGTPSEVLQADPSIDYNSSRSQWYRVYAAVMFAVYSIGVPVLFIGLVVLARRRQSDLSLALQPEIGFLAAPYNFIYFESFELLRKALMGSVLSALALANTAEATMGFIALSALSLFIVGAVQPFNRKREQQFAQFCLLLLCLLGVCTSSLLQFDSEGSLWTAILTLSGLLLACGLFGLVLTICLIVSDVRKMDTAKADFDFDPNSASGSAKQSHEGSPSVNPDIGSDYRSSPLARETARPHGDGASSKLVDDSRRIPRQAPDGNNMLNIT